MLYYHGINMESVEKRSSGNLELQNSQSPRMVHCIQKIYIQSMSIVKYARRLVLLASFIMLDGVRELIQSQKQSQVAKLVSTTSEKLRRGALWPHRPNRIAPLAMTALCPRTTRDDERRSDSMIDSFSKIEAEIRECRKCKIGEHAHNKVICRGSSKPDVLFIGEAAGAEEDKVGVPFVGQAGKVLNEALQYAGFSEIRFTIVNVLKCRPYYENIIRLKGGTFIRNVVNRQPTNEEVDNCRPFLLRQIKLYKPKMIVSLGNFAQGAMQRVYADGFLSESVVPYEHILHPATCLYLPDSKDEYMAQFKSIGQRAMKIIRESEIE